MRIYIGPTGVGLKNELDGFDVMPPAQQGDITSAVIDGETMIVLIDGYFTQHLAPWHKEILYAIQSGCRVIGAGSLGALRAVECERYGMEPIGKIAEWYKNGKCIDDSDVALTHSCSEDGYTPFSVPLVNIIATCEKIGLSKDIIDKCKYIFYMERSWKMIESVIGNVCDDIKKEYVNQKQLDALEAIKASKYPSKTKKEIPNNIFSRNFISMVKNDVPVNGIRPWEIAKKRDEASDFFLLTELAMQAGICVSNHDIFIESSKMWKEKGIENKKTANEWLIKNNVTDEQWNKFAIRRAIRQAARNWLDSSSYGCDIVHITNEYQLLTKN